jgi:hypothetical protein
VVRLTLYSIVLLVALCTNVYESSGQENVGKPQVGGGPTIPSKGYLVEESGFNKQMNIEHRYCTDRAS